MQPQKLKMLKLKFLLPIIAFMFSFFVHGQEITNNTFGKGLVNVIAKDSSYSLNFAVRFQSLFTSNWDYPDNENLGSGEANFLIRRSRMKFGGFVYSPKLTYKIELGLSNRDISGASAYTSNAPRYLLDAVLMWNFYENFTLWAGQAKLPGNRERVISSANLETVDRSLVNSYFNVDRETGVQLRHFFNIGENFVVKEAFAISQGEGRNVTTGNIGGYQYTGRVEILPFGNFDDYSGADLKREESPKLALGVSYDNNNNAVRTRSNAGTFMITDYGLYETDVNTLFVDGMFKYRGWSFMGEYAKRTSPDPVAQNSDATLTGNVVNAGTGLNLQSGYVFKNNFQVLGRYTKISPEEFTGTDEENQYTLGFSKYIVGHKLKLQTDISYNDFGNNFDNNLRFRFQFDVHF